METPSKASLTLLNAFRQKKNSILPAEAATTNQPDSMDSDSAITLSELHKK
jgi:hypothetical protein